MYASVTVFKDPISAQVCSPAASELPCKGEPIQVDVLDAEIEWLADAPTTTVEYSGDEIVGLATLVADGLEECLRLGNARGVALVSRTGGPQSPHVAQWLCQHLLVKEQDGVEGLVLGAGGDIMLLGQSGEEKLEFLGAGQVPRPSVWRAPNRLMSTKLRKYNG